ncbi:MAG TPA: radical SAM family heme chaperone HemW [Anaerovoracaceae bacterium]|nr:radical SAM family heme chaperone HemW [Anaerovoracaceae bacterium]
MKGLGLYIHIPFCARRCSYCDFLTYDNTSEEDHNSYMNALSSELKYYAGSNVVLDTVYIGGGTPSFLNPDLIFRLMAQLRKDFTVHEEAEITIEANPGLLDENRLSIYRRAGINRLSLGVQSLDDKILDFIGRIHDRETFIDNFHLARKHGFSNVSLDLIFAIPGQSNDIWIDNLKEIIYLGPEHISFYALQIEEETPIYSLIREGSVRQIDDETDRIMYHCGVELLKRSGYEHYEISNAAKPGYKSRHNLKYWSMDEYLGVGLGSHSFFNGKRFSNETDLKKYIGISKQHVYSVRHRGGSPWTAYCHEGTRNDNMAEYMFTGMRKVEGIYIPDFIDRFGISPMIKYEKQIEIHSKTGLLIIDQKSRRIRLMLKGMDLFNSVLKDFV